MRTMIKNLPPAYNITEIRCDPFWWFAMVETHGRVEWICRFPSRPSVEDIANAWQAGDFSLL
jgi:hypothetical protein